MNADLIKIDSKPIIYPIVIVFKKVFNDSPLNTELSNCASP